MTEEGGTGEPTGRTTDGTLWEEARPPHLPDSLVDATRRVPLAAWLFIVLAIATLAWELRDRVGSIAELDPYGVLSLTIGLIPPVATCLFGAALFVRHPRARSTDPRIVLGIVLLVLVELVSVMRFAVVDVMWSNADGDPFAASPVNIGLIVAAELFRVFGLVYVARGLLDARAMDDDPGTGRRNVLVFAFALLGVAAFASSYAIAFSKNAIDLGPNGGVVGVVAVLVAAVLVYLAICYLTATMTTGATSGERPLGAWRLGTVGGWLLLLGTLGGYLVNAALWLAFSPASGAPDIYFQISQVFAYVIAAAYLVLLAAFAFGLPGVDEVGPDSDGERRDADLVPA